MSEGGKAGLLARLRRGLGRSSARLKSGIGDLLAKRRLDAESLEELEEILIAADLGVATAARLARALAERRFPADVTPDRVLAVLAEDIEAILAPLARPLAVDPARKPHVVLVCGVNGSGKTTTIGKLAHAYRSQGLSVMLAAGDTFRAAAVEQLEAWGARTGAPVVAAKPGADAAGLIYSALEKAKAEGTGLLLVDTAGRLQNKKHLMAELQKIVRVIKKLDETAPHDRLLVLDAATGQNAHSQVEVFRDMVDVSGLVLTKLDGTAKGGVVVALAQRFGLPLHAVGVGEDIDDLVAFDAHDFARSLLGLEGEAEMAD